MRQILFLLAFSCTCLTYAQGILKGQILDLESLRPVSGAFVSVRNFPSLDTLLKTDQRGFFSFEGPQANYGVGFRAKGYEDQNLLIRIDNGKTRELVITLKKRIELDALNRNTTFMSATRGESSVEKLTSAITQIKQEELNSQISRTLPEALIGKAGVWVEKNFHGGGSARIRGLAGNQALLMVDGIRINHGGLTGEVHNWLSSIDLFSIDRIEILRGGGGTAYGSDALGGVIQVFTRDPDFSSDGKLGIDFEGGLKYGAGFWDGSIQGMEQSSRAQLSILGSKVATMVGLSVKDFGHLLGGGGTGLQTPSSYSEVDIDFKTKLKLGKSGLITLALQRSTLDSVSWTLRRNGIGVEGFETFQLNPLQRSLGYLRYEKENKHPLSQKITFTASYQEFLEKRDREVPASIFSQTETERVGSSGFSLVNESAKDKRWVHTSGMDLYFEAFESERSSIIDSTEIPVISFGLYPELANMLRFGLFSIHQLKFGKFLFNGGLRYDYSRISAFEENFGDISLDNHPVSAHLGLAFQAFKQHRLSFEFNRQVRSPNMGDWRQLGDSGNALIAPNLELRPERGSGLEFAYTHSSKFLQFRLGAFTNYVSGMIPWYDLRRDGLDEELQRFVYRRAGTAYTGILGLEAELLWNIIPQGGWFLEANGSYSRINYSLASLADRPSRMTPPINGYLKLYFKKNKAVAGLWGQAAAAQNELSLEDITGEHVFLEGTESWAVVHAYASYGLEWGSIAFKLENLFDRDYLLRGSGIRAYGRSFWIDLKVVL
ncbi:MAG: TonB-dependent receptor [Bacteroidia bacterium]|nr:TonB-dependent receptor [Bacteroidia bacterium]